MLRIYPPTRPYRTVLYLISRETFRSAVKRTFIDSFLLDHLHANFSYNPVQYQNTTVFRYYKIKKHLSMEFIRKARTVTLMIVFRFGILQVLVSLSFKKIYLQVLARSRKSHLLDLTRSCLNKRLASTCKFLPLARS
jgi:hypothetical protein